MESILAWGIIGGLIGWAIGQNKGRPGEGFTLGLLLGPIGWLLVLGGAHQGPKCPACGGVVVAGASKCKNCGSDLAAAKRTDPARPYSELTVKGPTLLLCLLLLLPVTARAQEPVAVAKPAPDYKALFEAANDAAAKWKAHAEQMQAERDVARREREGAHRELTAVEFRNRWQADQLAGKGAVPSVPPASAQPSRPAPRREVVLAKHEHRLLPGLNEWVTFLGADALAVHMTIGPGTGTRKDVPMRRGLEGSGNNETLILDDGYGHRLIYLDTVRSKGDSGVFVIESR